MRLVSSEDLKYAEIVVLIISPFNFTMMALTKPRQFWIMTVDHCKLSQVVFPNEVAVYMWYLC